jgi:hypothetical protein
MFQDSAGTTPVTAVEQPVGLILDKSQGLALGPELVTNGDFATDTGWTKSGSVTWSSGQYVVADVGGTDAFIQQTLASTVSGAWYKINFTVSAATSTGRIYLGNILISTLGVGTHTVYCSAPASATYVRFMVVNADASATITNISVKLLSGNHATQATSASRPVLSARVNLLLATATLATQNVTTRAATYTLSFTGAGTVTTTGTNIGVYSAGTHSITCTAGTLTLTVVGAVTLADLRVANTGVGLPAYQAVVTSTNYDTTGFPYYLRFDGTDDSLATSTITPGIDKAQVFSGVRKQSDASYPLVVELSANVNSNNGALVIYCSGSVVNSAGWQYTSKGTVASAAQVGSGYASPITNTIVGLSDISGDRATLFANGAQIAQSTSDQGTGNYLAYPLYIGRRGGTTLPFNGNLYSLIVRFGANLDATTISNTETWVNGKTMAY